MYQGNPKKWLPKESGSSFSQLDALPIFEPGFLSRGMEHGWRPFPLPRLRNY
jgi:hypothetical protein